MTRKHFEMTQAQLDTLIAAIQPVPLIALQCGMPRSQQECANDAWAALGKAIGFDDRTVQPTDRGDRFFTAEPV